MNKLIASLLSVAMTLCAVPAMAQDFHIGFGHRHHHHRDGYGQSYGAPVGGGPTYVPPQPYVQPAPYVPPQQYVQPVYVDQNRRHGWDRHDRHDRGEP